MLNVAVDLVRKNIITSHEAQKRFGIPRRTIENKSKNLHNKAIGRPRVLTESEEKHLVNIVNMATEAGSPLSVLDLRIRAFNYLKENNREHVFNGKMPDIDDNVEEHLEDSEEDPEYNEENIDDTDDDYDTEDNEDVLIKSKKGKTILEFNGYRYSKVYKSNVGSRWNCSTKKDCSANVMLSGNDEIITIRGNHCHPPPRKTEVAESEKDAAVVITSRKGKEMLLFKQYTYRKQYSTLRKNKIRWVCSTMKNCHAYVFTDDDNCITSAYVEHCHGPPKYYLNPDHVLEALKGKN